MNNQYDDKMLGLRTIYLYYSNNLSKLIKYTQIKLTEAKQAVSQCRERKRRVISPRRGQGYEENSGGNTASNSGILNIKRQSKHFLPCGLKLEMSKTSVTWSLGGKNKSEKTLSYQVHPYRKSRI